MHSRWCSRWLRGSSGRASHHSWCRRPWCGCNARRWCRCPWRRGAPGGRSWRGSQRRRSGQSPRTPLRLQLSDAASSIAPTQSWALLSRHRDAQGAYGSAQSRDPGAQEQDPYQQRIKELRSLVHEVYRQASEAGQEACCQRAPIPAGGEADHQDHSHAHGNGRLALNGFWARFGRSPEGQSVKSQSGRQDSNLRPSAPKAPALPSCATPRFRQLNPSAPTS